MTTFGELTSIAHNLATSVSDGGSFLFDAIGIDVHAAALESPEGRVVVDFLTGEVIEGNLSEDLVSVLSKSPDVLEELASKHGARAAEYSTLKASFGVDEVYGPHFTVLVEDREGRRSEELYLGRSGRRVRRGHKAAASS